METRLTYPIKNIDDSFIYADKYEKFTHALLSLQKEEAVVDANIVFLETMRNLQLLHPSVLVELHDWLVAHDSNQSRQALLTDLQEITPFSYSQPSLLQANKPYGRTYSDFICSANDLLKSDYKKCRAAIDSLFLSDPETLFSYYYLIEKSLELVEILVSPNTDSITEYAPLLTEINHVFNQDYNEGKEEIIDAHRIKAFPS